MASQVFGRKWSVWMADSVLNKFPVFKDKWSYDYGVICKGLERIYEAYGDERYFEYIKENMGSFVSEDGTIRGYDMEAYNLDFVNNGKTLLYLYSKTGEIKYKIAADTLRKQLQHHPRILQGGFWHKKVYENQMWLDGLYMGAPFYAQYIHMFDENKDYSDVLLQFKLIHEHLWNEEKGLYYHGYDETRSQFWADPDTGKSANFWGRSIGWFAMALLDVYDYLEKDEDKAVLEKMINSLAAGLIKNLHPTEKIWYQVTDRPGDFCNYAEASSSAMFIYFIKKAQRLGILKEDYSAILKQVFLSYIHHFIEVGQDGDINLVGTVYAGGLGGDNIRDGSYDYYISEPRAKNHLLGIGAFLAAALEMEWKL